MTLQLLWEQDDPHKVLNHRFGFDSTEAAEAWVGRMIEQHWGLEVVNCERIVMSDQNALAWIRTSDQQRLLLKWSVTSERFERLAVISKLTAWLGTQGLPVSAPLASRDGQSQVAADGVSAGLQQVVSGTWLDVKDSRQVSAAGALLARLHVAIRDYPARSEAEAALTQPGTMTEQITGWIASDPATLSSADRSVLQALVEAAPPEPGATQLVHGDYRSANILLVDAEVTGVLDFEELRVDTPVGELARSAVLLGTLFHDWGPVSEQVRTEFLAGYRSVQSLTAAELAWWRILVLWYSLALVPPEDDPTGWQLAAAELIATATRTHF